MWDPPPRVRHLRSNRAKEKSKENFILGQIEVILSPTRGNYHNYGFFCWICY